MVIVGLTGSIGMGKSTASKMLRQMGVPVYDADAAVHRLQAPGGLALPPIEAAFPGVVKDGVLDRQALGARVFGNKEALRKLEAIVHPLVFERIVALEEGTAADAIVVHDIPLLAESGRADTFDAVLVVDVPEEQQVERGVARGMTESDVRDRMAKQAARDQRRAIATHLIDNTGSLDELRARVTALYDELRG